jgi:predicted methyltransferase
VVGSNGHVYAVEPTAFFQFEHFVRAVAELQGYAVAHPNVTVTTAAALEGLEFPEKLDLFWISRNYHDLHDKPRTAKVFDQTIRGKTDQFILKFRKPKQ